jgi:uncharacterized protein YndB with AHSA1/START domain
MGTIPLVFERDYEFPTLIVWDALVDAELVSGWLGEATITPEAGGEYNVVWPHRPTQAATFGRITLLQPLERLWVDTTDAGLLQFELEELSGGSRGTSTRLRLIVEIDIEPVFAPRVQADWLMNLEQLEDVLRGHPVDWANWDRDRQATWTQYLEDEQNSTQ